MVKIVNGNFAFYGEALIFNQNNPWFMEFCAVQLLNMGSSLQMINDFKCKMVFMYTRKKLKRKKMTNWIAK